MTIDYEIHAVVHLSSTAVYTVVGYFDAYHKKTKIMGLGIATTDAFYEGKIINRVHLLSAIHKSLHEAIDMAGVQVSHVGVSFASPSMIGQNLITQKDIVVQNPTGDNFGRAVTHDDVRDVLNQARDILAQQQQTDVQLCQQGFWLNDNQDAKEVVGMLANKLVAAYHAISVPSVFYQQMKGLFSSNGLEVHSMFFDGVASSEYALSRDEKKRGVCFVDIGETTTKVCLYYEGILLYSRCLEAGGCSVDTDIASTLGLTMMEAESLKKQHGSASTEKTAKSDFITLKKRHYDSELTVHLYQLASVIEARYLALFHEIFEELRDKQLDVYIGMGLVLAGGGACMKDLPHLIKSNFAVDVRQMGINPRVSIDTQSLSDEQITLLKPQLNDPKLHSIIGVLMYYQSEQYAKDERGQFGGMESVGLFGKLRQKYQHCIEWLKQRL